MAERRIRIDLDRLRDTTKVRYGRANLTVERMVSVYWTPVREALAAHRRGGASAEDVAWTFVKEQVTSYTPSFRWETADLTKLLPRVTDVTREPRIKAKTPAELVPELEALEKSEAERWKKTREQMQKLIRPLPSADLRKLFGVNLSLSSQLLSSITQVNQANQQIAKAFTPNYDQIVKAMQPQVKMFESLRFDWDKISKAFAPQARIAGLNIDPNIWKIHGPTDELWQRYLDQVAEVAKDTGSDDIAEVVKATADEAAVEPEQLDLAPLFERLNELSEHVKSLAPKDSTTRAILITVAAGLILRFIEYILATKYGIRIAPAEKPPH